MTLEQYSGKKPAQLSISRKVIFLAVVYNLKFKMFLVLDQSVKSLNSRAI